MPHELPSSPWIPCAFLTSILLVGCGKPDPTDTGDTGDTADTGTPAACEAGDNLCVMASGEVLARSSWPNAVLIDAVGRASLGTASAIGDFDEFMLALLANDGTEAGSIELWWNAEGGFDEPIYHDDPYYGVMGDPLPRTLSLEAALDLVRIAGHDQAFDAVSLNKPLWPIVEARYAFMHGAGVVFVDVATQSVTAE